MLCWTIAKSICEPHKAPELYFWGSAVVAQGAQAFIFPQVVCIHRIKNTSVTHTAFGPARTHSLLLELPFPLFSFLFLNQKGFADSSYEEQCHKIAPKSKALPHCNSKMQTFVGSWEDTTRMQLLRQDFSPTYCNQPVSPVQILASHLRNKMQKKVIFHGKKRKIMSHKALCRQQGSGCLLFLHSE